MEEKRKIIRTKIAMKVTCKCGGCVAVTMLYGGLEIDAEFMDTVAECSNDGGKIEIVNTDETPVKMSKCVCQ